MGKNDPYSPDYDPSYQGQDGRDVGHGDDFAVDTGKLYLAGLEHFPVAGGTYAGAAADAYYVEGSLRSLAETAGRPEIAAVADHALEMYEVLTVTSNRLYAAGEALVQIAADLAGTDEDVEGVMDGIVAKHRDILENPAPRPRPPVPGSPWSLAIPGDPLPGGGTRPDIPSDTEVDELLDGLDLSADLEEHEREQERDEEGAPA